MAIEVRCIEHLSVEQRQSLNLLYGPLVGKNSICLYEFLGSIQNLVELEDVYLLLNMNASQFDIARNHLEQYHLIETYVHGRGYVDFIICSIIARFVFMS